MGNISWKSWVYFETGNEAALANVCPTKKMKLESFGCKGTEVMEQNWSVTGGQTGKK